MTNHKRPPVHAHVRFQEERASFEGLNLKQRFEHIHQTNLWGAETSVSGPGSEDESVSVIKRDLPLLLKQLSITRLLDAPCGDASWITTLDLDIDYIGVDIVPEIINTLQQKANSGTIQGKFLLADITTDPLPKADAILCRDCLVHLSYENIRKTTDNFKRSSADYLITTHFTQWTKNNNIENGDWRALNFELVPFNWPKPRHILFENCTEAGGGYTDKSLSVWRLSDLP